MNVTPEPFAVVLAVVLAMCVAMYHIGAQHVLRNASPIEVPYVYGHGVNEFLGCVSRGGSVTSQTGNPPTTHHAVRRDPLDGVPMTRRTGYAVLAAIALVLLSLIVGYHMGTAYVRNNATPVDVPYVYGISIPEFESCMQRGGRVQAPLVGAPDSTAQCIETVWLIPGPPTLR